MSELAVVLQQKLPHPFIGVRDLLVASVHLIDHNHNLHRRLFGGGSSCCRRCPKRDDLRRLSVVIDREALLLEVLDRLARFVGHHHCKLHWRSSLAWLRRIRLLRGRSQRNPKETEDPKSAPACKSHSHRVPPSCVFAELYFAGIEAGGTKSSASISNFLLLSTIRFRNVSKI